MANEETITPDAPTPAAAGGLKAWLPMIATIIAMPVIAFAVTQFVLLPRLQEGLGIEPVAARTSEDGKTSATAHGASKSGGSKVSVPMTKLLVNVSGTMGSRYLLCSLSLTGSDPNFKSKVEQHDPQLRDMACGTLESKTLADLEKAGARNFIRSELINGFNAILGGPVIEEIYLTEFAIQ